MAGEATLSGSAAALKQLYPDGNVPKNINEQYALLKRLKKDTNFVAESAHVPIQNANTQGTGRTVANAQTALWQGNYVRFTLTRKSHYGLARITGEAMQAAVKEEGALVDLWDNETKGAAQTEMNVMATYLYGNGTAVLSGIDAGATVASATLQLASTANMNYYELNMLLQAVDSATSLSPTVRAGSARVTGIDRLNRTITTGGGNWSTQITDLVVTDFLVRYGDYASGGASNVITGIGEYIKGGSASDLPGTLHGLSRDSDIVRLAGQKKDYTGIDHADAVVDASALAGFQGIGYPNILLCNNIDAAEMKKAMAEKIHFNRPGGGKGEWGFSEISIFGEAGPIEVVADPFCPRNTAYLTKLDQFTLWSLKGAPHLQKYDGLDFVRLSTEDAFEVRFAFYGNLKCKNPAPHVKLLNWGVP